MRDILIFISLIIQPFIYGQQALPGIKAFYNVQKKVIVPNSNGQPTELTQLNYLVQLLHKAGKYIYWDKALYLDKHYTSELNVTEDNSSLSTWISLDSIQNIRYANTDSGIWRNQTFQAVDPPQTTYFKGALNPSALKWNYLPDIRDINGLRCQHAQMILQQKLRWDIWFCPDIPVNFTPFGQMNLPGIVVEAIDYNSNTNYSLTSYEITDKIHDELFWPTELNNEISDNFGMPKIVK